MSGNKRPQTFRDCVVCGKNFGPLNNLKRKCCSKLCGYKLRSITGTAKKGKHYPHLQRAEIRECPVCNNKFRAINDTYHRKQKYCSKKCWSTRGITYYQRTCLNCTIQFETVDKRQNYCCKDCSLSVHLGDKSHLWKGGLTEQSKIERTCAAYRKWRLDVFKRDNFTCVDCGKSDRTIEAHHIKAQSDNPELRYKIDNGITLCHECHKETDNYGYKQRWGN